MFTEALSLWNRPSQWTRMTPKHTLVLVRFWAGCDGFENQLMHTRRRSGSDLITLTPTSTRVCVRGAWQEREEREAYRKAVELTPLDGKAWSNLGVSYSGLAQYDLAVGAFRRAQELLPEHLHILVSLGHVYGQQGRYAEAIETYLKAPSLLPENPDANCHIAWCYYQVKQYEEVCAGSRKRFWCSPTTRRHS